MTYLYEQLGPERFQEFCQSLLIEDAPRLQCFPVAQQDGGRDGWDPERDEVLQVKFKRIDETENSDWMISALKDELPKIERLAASGAKKYLMVTNARGTAALGGGRIDKVQAWMNKFIPIPSQVYWRDELDRRVDRSPAALRLRFQAILSGDGAIQLVLEGLLGADSRRQRRTLVSFVATQYEEDSRLKFKQVDLSNDLLDLFVDVPVHVSQDEISRLHKGGRRELSSALRSEYNSSRAFEIRTASGEIFYAEPSENQIGAAEFLLGTVAQELAPWVVLRGAPGQGKSTLAQYVCQVHRAQFLQKSDFLNSIPDGHQISSFRIPMKVDLRDFSAYLDGSSPFANGDGVSGVNKSLEGFIAELISHKSGGESFDVSDLQDVLSVTPCLFFLDGLDEVAGVESRQVLIDAIAEAMTRLRAGGSDIQVVVTSRPSLFGKAPSFSKQGFVTPCWIRYQKGTSMHTPRSGLSLVV